MKGHKDEALPKGTDAKGAELVLHTDPVDHSDPGGPNAPKRANRLTLAQAEDIALKLDGCIGFTFEGEPYELQQLQTQQDTLKLKTKRTAKEEEELKKLEHEIGDKKQEPDQKEGPIHFISGPTKKFFVAREKFEEPIVTVTNTGEKDEAGNVKAKAKWQTYGAYPDF